jgi:hypothetical protein
MAGQTRRRKGGEATMAEKGKKRMKGGSRGRDDEGGRRDLLA